MSAKTNALDFELMIYLARAHYLTAEHLSLFATVDLTECLYMIKGRTWDKRLEREIRSALGSDRGIYRRAEATLLTQGTELLGVTSKVLPKIESYVESGQDVRAILSAVLSALSGRMQEVLKGDELLERSIGSYWMTAIVLRALAAEIMLKALTYKKSGNYEGTHDLKKLLENLNGTLDANTRERIRNLEVQHKIDLEKTLEKHRDDFITLRYAYERPGVKIDIQDMRSAVEILHTLVSDELSRDGSEVSGPGTPTG